MIVSQHMLLGIGFSRFAKHHRPLPNILNDHIYIANFHNIIGGGFPRINLYGLNFILFFLGAVFLLWRMRLDRPLLGPV